MVIRIFKNAQYGRFPRNITVLHKVMIYYFCGPIYSGFYDLTNSFFVQFVITLDTVYSEYNNQNLILTDHHRVV